MTYPAAASLSSNGPTASVVVSDLHANPIVRAAPLTRMLQRLGFRCTVLGILRSDQSVYPPYADAFDYVICRDERSLANAIGGDLIYCCKPLPRTIRPSVIASRRDATPMILDVEDDNLEVCQRTRIRRMLSAVRKVCRRPRCYAAIPAHRMRRHAVATTVASRMLQDFYGGTILYHGPDESIFDPQLREHDPQTCRRQLGLPQRVPLALFAGYPRTHKGLDLLVHAIEFSPFHLVLAGPERCDEFDQAQKRLAHRCHRLGMIDNNIMPKLLAAVDVVPVPQRDTHFANAQMPAKLIEAMSMAKSVVVSNCGDLPEIVGHGTSRPRGWVFRCDDVNDLKRCLLTAIDDHTDAVIRRQRARTFFVSDCGLQAGADRLRAIIGSIGYAHLLPPSVKRVA